MITNERQYNITRQQLAKLQRAVAEFDLTSASERIGSETLAQAELKALESEVEVLRSQVEEYEQLRSGAVTRFTASGLEELPSVLIRARIAKGLSQRELAKLVGLKEQQIQRYEADEYASASLCRLREIAEALRLNVTEVAEFV